MLAGPSHRSFQRVTPHSLLLLPFLSTDQGYLAKDAKAMEILRLEGIEVWNESGIRTLDDQSAVQASGRSWGLECTHAA